MKIKILFSLAILSVLVSCAQKAETSEAFDTIDATAVQNQAVANPVNLTTARVPDIYTNGKNTIKKAHYRFQVSNVKATSEALEVATRKFGAYIETSDMTLNNPVLEQKITIRVLNEFFGDLMKEIDQYPVFTNFRNIETDDVSKDFVDLESRLRTKREVEQRYMDILRNKAGTIEELLEAENKIGDLHEEIEAVVSRMNFLKDQVRYSTIQLEYYQTITQEIAEVQEDSFGDSASIAFITGWHGIKNILLALVYIWPLVFLCGGVLIWIRLRKKKAALKTV